LEARLGVEGPLAVSSFHKGEGEWPKLVADLDDFPAVLILNQDLLCRTLADLPVGFHRVLVRLQLGPIDAEQCGKTIDVVGRQRRLELVDGRCWVVELRCRRGGRKTVERRLLGEDRYCGGKSGRCRKDGTEAGRLEERFHRLSPLSSLNVCR